MTIKREVMHWIVCDGCGEQPESDGYEILYRSKLEAVKSAVESDWYEVGDRMHACPYCVKFEGDKPTVNPNPGPRPNRYPG